MIPYMVGKLAPNSSHLARGLVNYVPGRSCFRAVPSQNGDKFVTSPPPPQSLSGSELVSDAMRVKHLLKLTLKFASLVSSNGAELQTTRGDVLGDDIS